MVGTKSYSTAGYLCLQHYNARARERDMKNARLNDVAPLATDVDVVDVGGGGNACMARVTTTHSGNKHYNDTQCARSATREGAHLQGVA